MSTIFSIMQPSKETLALSPGVRKHIVYENENVRTCLLRLNYLHSDAILFVCNEENMLIGSLTDGDLRRGFINGLDFDSYILDFLQPDPLYIFQDELHLANLSDLKNRNFLIVPIVDRELRIVDILNLRINHSKLPLDVIIMAGGRGERLRPLTDTVPKPMLPVGDKPILEHNIDRLIKYGINNIYISVNYLAEQIKDHFGDGTYKGIHIDYVCEGKPLGTAGSINLVKSLKNDYLLVMNSDLLTNIDFDAFFQVFIKSGADMAVATVNFHVQVPYGVLDVDGENFVNALKEKPKYSYQSNAGIYLIKKDILTIIPHDKPYNITELMQHLVNKGKKLVSFPILGYWMDIGNHADYQRANEDVVHVKW